MGTYASQDSRKGKLFHDDLKGFLVLSLFDHLDIALDVQSGRACQAAGGFILLFNGISAGDSLGVLFICGPAGGQTPVEFVGKFDGTDFGAIAAAGAFGKVDKTGVLLDGSGKATFFPLEINQFRIGDQFNIQMPADLDQFG